MHKNPKNTNKINKTVAILIPGIARDITSHLFVDVMEAGTFYTGWAKNGATVMFLI